MINRHSLPVWMLADTMLAVLLFGVMSAATLCLPILSAITPALDLHSLKRERDRIAQRLDESQSKLKRTEQILDDTRNDLDGVRKLTADQEARLAAGRSDLSVAKRALDNDKSVRRELIPLRGDFSRTIFVIDRSLSMGKIPAEPLDRPNWDSNGTAWSHVQKQINVWLRHLPIDSFRVLCFNHKIEEYPTSEETWVTGDSARIGACAFLEKLQPDGRTYTEQALERAIQCKPSCIVLLTDGAPSTEVRRFDEAKNRIVVEYRLDVDQRERIIRRVVNREWSVPINVIALNGYSDKGDPTLIDFLHQLAARSGGGFMAL